MFQLLLYFKQESYESLTCIKRKERYSNEKAILCGFLILSLKWEKCKLHVFLPVFQCPRAHKGHYSVRHLHCLQRTLLSWGLAWSFRKNKNMWREITLAILFCGSLQSDFSGEQKKWLAIFHIQNDQSFTIHIYGELRRLMLSQKQDGK